MSKNLIDIKQQFLKFVMETICDLPKQVAWTAYDNYRKMETCGFSPHLSVVKTAGFNFATQTRVLTAKVAFVASIVDGIPIDVYINIQEVNGSVPLKNLFDEALFDLKDTLKNLPGINSVRCHGDLF